MSADRQRSAGPALPRREGSEAGRGSRRQALSAGSGAALLTAMIIVALVATLAGAMVWQQWRAVQVEAAERARTQSAWILSGALDWARLILREDARRPAAPTTSASPGRCRWPRRGCRPSSPPTRTTPTTRPSVPLRRDHRRAGALQPEQPGRRRRQDRPGRAGGAAAPVRDRRRLGRRRDADRRRPARRRAADARSPSASGAARRRRTRRPAADAALGAPARLARHRARGGAPLEPYVVHPAGGDRRQRQHRARAKCWSPRSTGLDLADAERLVQSRQRVAVQVPRRPAGAGCRRCRRAASTGSASARTSSRSAAGCAWATVVLEQRSLVQRRGPCEVSRAAARARLRRATAAAREAVQSEQQYCDVRYNDATLSL